MTIDGSVPVAVMLPAGAGAEEVVQLARAAADAGVRELWVAEDLGLHGGIALTAHLLATLPEVAVGLAIAPAAARHPAFLAMQAATMGALHPGRLRLGIGHGMPAWMQQLGLWSLAPVARLEATLEAVARLLAGERVDLDRGEVLIDDLALSSAPVDVPLYAGVRGPRSLAACAPHVAGVVLAGWSGPDYTRWAREVVTDAAGAPRRVVSSARLAYDPRDPDGALARLRVQFDRDRAGDALAQQLAPVERGPDDRASATEVGIAGGSAALADGIARWQAGGADTVLLDPLGPGDLRRLLVDGIPTG